MFALPPNSISGLESVLDGSAWGRWVEDDRVFPVENVARAVGYLRLKPEDSCRLVVFGGRPDDPTAAPHGFYLQLFATAERAREVFAKEQTRRHRGAAAFEPFLCESTAAVAVPFPNDSELPDLRHVFEPDRFRRTLGELLPAFPGEDWRIKRRRLLSEVLSYKPGRRCVLATSLELRHRSEADRRSLTLHVQVEPRGRAEDTFTKQQRISGALASSGSQAARPSSWVRSRGLIATEWIDGTTLQSEIDDGTFCAESLAAVGRELATLHSLRVELPHRPSPIERADTVSRLTRDLVRLLPEDSRELGTLGGELTRALQDLSFERSAIVHGDFHPGQVVMREGDPVLIDFDRAGRGYAVEDLGNFMAYLLENQLPAMARDQFFAGYAEVAALPSKSLIRAATATSLFHRLPAPFRRLDPEWPAETRRLMSLAQEAIQGEIR